MVIYLGLGDYNQLPGGFVTSGLVLIRWRQYRYGGFMNIDRMSVGLAHTQGLIHLSFPFHLLTCWIFEYFD